MSSLDVRKALIQAYIDGSFGLTTIYENTKSDSPNDGEWAYLTVIPIDYQPAGLGRGGDDEETGILQIDLNYPLDQGDNSILAKYEEMRAYFQSGRKFVYNGQTVIIRSCGRSQGRIDKQNYRISVSINWFSRLSRS